MFQSIDLKFTETGKMTLPAKGVTVFVGPNNSGKSLILQEIEQAFEIHPFPSGLKILQDYEVEWPSAADVKANIEKYKPSAPSNAPVGHVFLGRLSPAGGRQQQQFSEEDLIRIVNDKAEKRWMATQYGKWGVVRLDGRSRFNLTNDVSAGDILGPPQNILMHLFKNDDDRHKVRSLIKEAFGVNFVVDPTSLGNLRIRLSAAEPLTDEQSLNEAARSFHSNAIHIKDASDGVQAFTGIVTAVCSGEFHTILVDEPEAFLHPPLARKLGKNLAELASQRGGCLMASTHSADFLMGCVQASSSVQVVRLEYSNGKSSGRKIDPEILQSFFKKPLMRSSNVVSGLFHDGVVVCESDNDRAFYAEIYHRLLEQNSELPSILFVNAQNKQTIRDIIGPLRRFGVPSAAIVDIDLVKDGGSTWTGWLTAANIPTALHNGYGQLRSAINSSLSATGKNMSADGGLNILGDEDKAAAEQLFQNIEQYGIFPIHRGELEAWLPELGVPGKKTDWTIAMLERLGSDPTDMEYVKPADDDVWEFLRKIVSWIHDPARRGMT